MQHPTLEAVDFVIDTFKSVLPHALAIEDACKNQDQYPLSVNMEYGFVDHSCGTPMCHAGWYAAARKLTKYNTYRAGVQIMNEDLGFKTLGESITRWADQNPKLWGNLCGSDMFSLPIAFDKCESIQDIINHWQAVRNRLSDHYKSLENATSIN